MSLQDTSAETSAGNPVHFLTAHVTIPIAGQILHKGRSKIYELLGDGKLTGVKDGPRTLITVESIRTYQASLQPVQIKAPPPPRLESLERLHARQREQAERRRDDRRNRRSKTKA